MLAVLMNKWKQNRRNIVVVFFLITLLNGVAVVPECVYAEDSVLSRKAVSRKETDLPREVIVVNGEKELINKLILGMKKHQSYFAFYYPGIEKDFIRYRKESISYQTFMDKLAAKNGYITGILMGSCITICGSKNKYVTFQFYYLTTKRQEQRIDRIVRSIARKYRKGSRASRAKKAYDYLIQHVQYDGQYYNPYYIFTKGKGICMSYALAYQRLMQEMKIPCVYIKGNNHAWNMVKIGPVWYNVDVTWDDANKGYRYFLKCDRDFPGHKRPESKWLSSLRKAKRSYNLKKLK